MHCDVGDSAQTGATIEATVDRFGGLDVLHNNAGIHESDLTEDLTVDTLPDDVWIRVYAINIRGMWQAIKYAAPHLRRSTRKPAIVNAASLASYTGYPMASADCSTKGAVLQSTKTAAIDLAPEIRVNCYCPGVDRHADGRQVLRGRRRSRGRAARARRHPPGASSRSS